MLEDVLGRAWTDAMKTHLEVDTPEEAIALINAVQMSSGYSSKPIFHLDSFDLSYDPCPRYSNDTDPFQMVQKNFPER